ncbi:unnamed protein product, partial [Choristocarpus tenellus]
TLWQEQECLLSLIPPNIIDIYGMCRVSINDEYFEVCLLLEQLAMGTIGDLLMIDHFHEKTLLEWMRRAIRLTRISFKRRLSWVLELALALQHVHEKSAFGM